MKRSESPSVSVVVKSFNHEAYVAKAIESILSQSFENFELLVCDDGSADATAAIVAGFDDPRIHLEIAPENRGISASMNSLIARARGEYIAILNSDDFALPMRLEKQVQFLAEHRDVGAVFTLPQTVDEHGHPAASYFDFGIAFSLPDFSSASWLRFFFFKANCLCAPTAMISRKVYQQAGPYDRRLVNLQDLDMWIRMSAHTRIHVIAEPLTAFRVRTNHGNLSAPRTDTMLRSQFEYAQILQRYQAIDRALLVQVFAAEAAAYFPPGRSIRRSLAELALTVDSPAHRAFALQTLYDVADSEEDLRRLTELTGSVDVFGIVKSA